DAYYVLPILPSFPTRRSSDLVEAPISTIILSLTEILNSFKAFSNFKPPLLTKGNFPFTFNGISILYFVPALSNLLFSEYTWPAIIIRFDFSLVSIIFLSNNNVSNHTFFILSFPTNKILLFLSYILKYK